MRQVRIATAEKPICIGCRAARSHARSQEGQNMSGTLRPGLLLTTRLPMRGVRNPRGCAPTSRLDEETPALMQIATVRKQSLAVATPPTPTRKKPWMTGRPPWSPARSFHQGGGDTGMTLCQVGEAGAGVAATVRGRRRNSSALAATSARW